MDDDNLATTNELPVLPTTSDMAQEITDNNRPSIFRSGNLRSQQTFEWTSSRYEPVVSNFDDFASGFNLELREHRRELDIFQKKIRF